VDCWKRKNERKEKREKRLSQLRKSYRYRQNFSLRNQAMQRSKEAREWPSEKDKKGKHSLERSKKP